MYNLLSAFIGVLITVMIFVNSTLSSKINDYWTSVIIHTIGITIMILILTFKRLKVSFKKQLPIYLYTGGVIGVFTVISNNITFNVIGASLTLALGLLGQTVTSMILDHYGFMGMKQIKINGKKIIGLLIITAGIIVMTIY